MYETLTRRKAGDYRAGLASKTVFWIDFMIMRQKGPELDPDLAADSAARFVFSQFDAFAHDLMKEAFPKSYIVSYCMTVNPPGSMGQNPHVDYGRGYGALFIPLQKMMIGNTITTLWPPLPDSHDQVKDYPEERLLEAYGYYQKTVTVSEPFSVLKLGHNVLHGGVSNTTDYVRETLCIAVTSDRRVLDEPFAASAEKLADLDART